MPRGHLRRMIETDRLPARAPTPLLTPMLLAFGQLDDPALLGVLLRSVAFACLSFAGLGALGLWASHALLASWWTHWLGDLATLAITLLLALWLFLPVAIVIATCFLDAIASAVDRRFYPGLPVPRGAPIVAQLWDGLALGARVLALNLIGLILAILLPGVGALLAWAIAAWALGRGLFVAVAMRRLGLIEARAAYRGRRGAVLIQGAALALLASVPLANLLVPILGAAAMEHVLLGPPAGRRM